MKRGTSLGKFDLFADAPDAAAKMRELVLELAVGGLLSEQKRIVAKVDKLITLVDALEQQLAASHAAGEERLAALVGGLTAA